MKATVWLWPLITTLLCASQFVYTAQRGEYGDFEDSTLVQNDFLLEKRLKPSLSIVNPLDVLRQRLMLETARRQQREQNRQVEINRQILKQVGKRKGAGVMTNSLFDFLRQDDNKVDLNDDGDDNFQTRYFYSLH